VIRLDTPAGLVEAAVEVDDGRARAVTIRNVPAYLHLRDAVVTVPGFGPLTLDLAWGGNFYAILPAASVGLAVELPAHDALVAAGLAVMSAVNEQLSFAHPEHQDIAECHHVILTAPASEPDSARGATVIHPGWVDRSPCGTGTSARMAQLHARGELGLHREFGHYSLIGSRFTGQLVATARVGEFPAVVPTIRGRAWITGMASYLLDPEDPFPAGFLISALAPAGG
jgi:proline racemase